MQVKYDKQQYPANKQAFSLVEVVLIVALIAVSFIAITNLVQKTLQVEHLAKNDFIARGLAEECIELAEELRNYNEINNSGDYDNGITDGTEYAIDHTGTPVYLSGASIGTAPSRLQLDLSGGDYYQHGTGDDTVFYRTVIFNTDASGAAMDVECVVQYGNRGDTRQVKLFSKIYDLP